LEKNRLFTATKKDAKANANIANLV
jgi:hypothetical protein